MESEDQWWAQQELDQRWQQECMMVPVNGFPGYSVTAEGRIYSALSKRFLTPCVSNGYQRVVLCRPGLHKHMQVHDVVLTAFHGPRPDGMVANHKNAMRADNRSSNLEWVTQSENVLHAYRMGLRVINEAHRERCAALGRAKRSYTDEQIALIKGEYTGEHGQVMALSRKHNVSRYIIAQIIYGNNA